MQPEVIRLRRAWVVEDQWLQLFLESGAQMTIGPTGLNTKHQFIVISFRHTTINQLSSTSGNKGLAQAKVA